MSSSQILIKIFTKCTLPPGSKGFGWESKDHVCFFKIKLNITLNRVILSKKLFIQ